MRDDRAIFAMIAELLRRQFRFYGAIVVLGVIGIVLAHGLNWTTALVIAIAVVVIPFGFVLVSFWISVFSGMSRSGDMR